MRFAGHHMPRPPVVLLVTGGDLLQRVDAVTERDVLTVAGRKALDCQLVGRGAGSASKIGDC